MANEEVIQPDEKEIRHQMEETRTALTEKLETLENQVVETVQGATSAVNETVENIKDSVQETVSTVKDTVEGTVTAVKDTVSDSVETVKEYMDLRAWVEQYPWLMLGGSVGFGYMLGVIFPKAEPFKTQELARVSDGPPRAHGPTRNGGHRRRHEAPARPSWLAEFAPELTKLKALALGALFGTAREMISRSVPGHMGQQLSQIVDNVTAKIGGEPMSHSDWESSTSSGYSTEGGSHEGGDQAKMGGSMGSAQRKGPQAMGRFDR